MTTAVRAVGAGLLKVLRAPGLVIGIYLITVIAALPFGVVLGSRLQTALREQQASRGVSGEIDAEWWQEFQLHARGLESTFTPSVIGFAAPLDNLSALLDGDRRPLALLAPVALYAVLWMFLWGGVLERLLRGRRIGVRAFLAAGAAHFPRFLGIGLAALVACVVLYGTLHAWLFGPVFARLQAAAASEREAFVWRVLLYVVFGVVLIAITICADYMRIWSVADRRQRLSDVVRTSIQFLRSNLVATVLVYVTMGVMFIGLVAGYGAAEIVGGAHVGGWRAVALGQAYIGGRLALRLVLAASVVDLTRKA